MDDDWSPAVVLGMIALTVLLLAVAIWLAPKRKPTPSIYYCCEFIRSDVFCLPCQYHGKRFDV